MSQHMTKCFSGCVIWLPMHPCPLDLVYKTEAIGIFFRVCTSSALLCSPRMHVTRHDKVLRQLCDMAAQAPTSPLSTQRGEESRAISMIKRCGMANRLEASHTPFVLGKWKKQVEPAGGIRRQMYLAAQACSAATGTGLCKDEMDGRYTRAVHPLFCNLPGYKMRLTHL
jgi:hypothetical protein